MGPFLSMPWSSSSRGTRALRNGIRGELDDRPGRDATARRDDHAVTGGKTRPYLDQTGRVVARADGDDATLYAIANDGQHADRAAVGAKGGDRHGEHRRRHILRGENRAAGKQAGD